MNEVKKKRIPWNRGKKMSFEYRKKLSEAHKGHKHSEETKKRMSNSSKWHDPKVCQHHSEVMKKLWKDPGYHKRVSESLKKANSFPKVCERKSETMKGRIFSEAHKKNLSIALMKPRTDGYCDVWSDEEYKMDCMKNYCEICKVKKKQFIAKDGRIMSNLQLHYLKGKGRLCSKRFSNSLY